MKKKIKVIKDPHINVRKIILKKNVKFDLKLDSKKKIISIGRLTKQKNYIFLLQVFKNLLKLRSDLHLVIIGEGEDRKLIEKNIQNLEISNHVSLEGYQENIYKYLNNSICYFSASIWEGPDLAMLDAAFSNVPIICSDCKSGRKEFIEDNKRGYIFKTNDINSSINAFKFFFEEDQLELKKKIISSKKEVRNFTPFRYYLNLSKIIDN